MISLLRWLASRGIIEVKVTDNDKKNCTKFTWYLNFHQHLRSPHYLTSVGKSPERSWQGCRPLRSLVCYCSLISETDSRSASFIRLSIKGMVSSVLLPRLTVFLAGRYSTTLVAAFSGWQAFLVLSFSFHKSLSSSLFVIFCFCRILSAISSIRELHVSKDFSMLFVRLQDLFNKQASSDAFNLIIWDSVEHSSLQRHRW